jgi:hypothetical protein
MAKMGPLVSMILAVASESRSKAAALPTSLDAQIRPMAPHREQLHLHGRRVPAVRSRPGAPALGRARGRVAHPGPARWRVHGTACRSAQSWSACSGGNVVCSLAMASRGCVTFPYSLGCSRPGRSCGRSTPPARRPTGTLSMINAIRAAALVVALLAMPPRSRSPVGAVVALLQRNSGAGESSAAQRVFRCARVTADPAGVYDLDRRSWGIDAYAQGDAPDRLEGPGSVDLSLRHRVRLRAHQRGSYSRGLSEDDRCSNRGERGP